MRQRVWLKRVLRKNRKYILKNWKGTMQMECKIPIVPFSIIFLSYIKRCVNEYVLV